MPQGLLVAVLGFTFLSIGSAPCRAQEQQQPTAPETGTEQKKPVVTGQSTDAWQVLNEGLAHDDAEKRREAVSALSVAGPAAPIALLEKFLDDHDPGVRQAAVVALGELKVKRSIPKLRRALDDDSAEVAFSAARVLWDMGDRSGRTIMVEVLAGERVPAKGAAQSKMAEFKKTLKNPAALALFGIKQSGVLGPFGIGLEVAEELRKDKSSSARILAADALATDRDVATAKELEDALTDKNWAVRATAAQALAKRNYRPAVPALRDLLDEKKEVVRYTAAAAIIRLTRARYVAKRDK